MENKKWYRLLVGTIVLRLTGVRSAYPLEELVTTNVGGLLPCSLVDLMVVSACVLSGNAVRFVDVTLVVYKCCPR